MQPQMRLCRTSACLPRLNLRPCYQARSEPSAPVCCLLSYLQPPLRQTLFPTTQVTSQPTCYMTLHSPITQRPADGTPTPFLMRCECPASFCKISSTTGPGNFFPAGRGHAHNYPGVAPKTACKRMRVGACLLTGASRFTGTRRCGVAQGSATASEGEQRQRTTAS